MENEQTYFTSIQKATGLATPEEPQLNAAQLEPETRRQITVQHRANTLITRPKYYLFSMFPIFFSSIEIMPFGMLTNSMKSGL